MGKKISCLLMDGNTSGRVKCTNANWTGIAYQIPRTEIDNCREYLGQSGVYFLFGAADVYIGQAGESGEGIFMRLQEHKADNWTKAVIFTTQNNSLGSAEISWLGNYFHNLAVATSRFKVKSGNQPGVGDVTEEKQSELEEFAEYAKAAMGVLGHKLFKPISESESVSTPADSDENVYYVRSRGTDARCKFTEEGVVVLSGSRISADVVPSCSQAVKSLRENNKEIIGADHVLSKPLTFNTPSGASTFILGRPSNGNVDLKTADGRTLKEITETI